MKKLILSLIVAGASCSAFQSHAIEGLTIQPQNGNIVLTWPSTSASTYIVQYRDAFDTNHPWQTLQSGLSGNDGTTSYTDPGRVPIPPAGGSGQNMATRSPMLATDGSTTDTGIIMPPMPPLPPGLTIGSDGTVTLATMGMATADAGLPSPGPIGQVNTNPPVPPTCRFYRVVESGVKLYGITDGMVLSNYLSLPVELGNDSGSISSISLLCDEVPIPNATLIPPFNYPLVFALNTLLLTNGAHQITASAQWDGPNGIVGEAESAPISVVVSNEVSFENWMPLYGELGDSLLVRATSAHTNTQWWVDIYSISGGNYTYIGTLGGHTYDGNIYCPWNLVGPHGESYSSSDGFAFEVSTEYADPPAPPTYKVKDPWPGKGAWAAVCQHAWDNSLDTESIYSELSGFVGVAKDAMNCTVLPTPNSDNDPYALTFDANNSQGDTDWANFRQALFNPATRNLLYFGHGGQGGLGYNATTTNRYISVKEISANLHTLPNGQTNRHGFRFVFIDACATSEGLIPEAFGIIHKENVPGGNYTDSSLRYSAYAGWPNDKSIGILSGRYPNYNHINYILHLETEMILYGRGIKDAAIRACHYNDVSGIGEKDLKVYGYWDLTIGAFNQ